MADDASRFAQFHGVVLAVAFRTFIAPGVGIQAFRADAFHEAIGQETFAFRAIELVCQPTYDEIRLEKVDEKLACQMRVLLVVDVAGAREIVENDVEPVEGLFDILVVLRDDLARGRLDRKSVV